MRRTYRDGVSLVIGLSAVALVTLVYVRWLHVSNAAIVSTSLLLVVLFVAGTGRFDPRGDDGSAPDGTPSGGRICP